LEKPEEVILNLPPWFFYEPLVLSYNAEPVKVRVRSDNFDLDLDAIERVLTPRTCAIIVNSPNNPTGRIYPPETLRQLAELLTRGGERNGRPIYLLSDEAYSRIVYDGAAFPSPTQFHPYSFLVYTYGKTLLTPGERMGYVAFPPTMPDRESLRLALLAAQLTTGYAFANAVLQYAIPELEPLSIDIGHLQHKRDWLVRELSSQGYQVTCPEGTFYLLVRSPLPDDREFTDLLAVHRVYCLPGSVFEMPGYFRISLTANDAMIERALPGFRAAFEKATNT